MFIKSRYVDNMNNNDRYESGINQGGSDESATHPYNAHRHLSFGFDVGSGFRRFPSGDGGPFSRELIESVHNATTI
ncbi:hypothetical protein J6TS7_01900 [Paenibacillus dendritiformis]|nr:hypothetical protein J6TS7_01900 [Paenibacillus dendritiformis]